MCQKEPWGAIFFATKEAHSTQRGQPRRMHGPGPPSLLLYSTSPFLFLSPSPRPSSAPTSSFFASSSFFPFNTFILLFFLIVLFISYEVQTMHAPLTISHVTHACHLFLDFSSEVSRGVTRL